MRAISLLGCLLLGRWNVSAFEVELKELVNPSLARVTDEPFSGLDRSCAPAGCKGILTRDGSRNAGSRYGCTQQEPGRRFSNACTVNYRLNEEKFSGGPGRTISSVHVAFTADSETSLQVVVDDNETDTWTGEKGSTKLQEIPGVAGFFGDELELMAVMSEGSYIGITETEIYVEVDDVPVTGIAASERVSVGASATVNSDAAMETLDGSTSISSSWFCSEGDVCEITYDLLEVQSTEQIRIAFVEQSSTAGATFNLYTAGADEVFSAVLSGVTAGPRDASIEGLQTFGGVRALARYVKIEGVQGTGGEFAISEVDIRLNENAPAYPTSVDSSLVPVGRLPLGQDFEDEVQHDPRPASEGGCSSGLLQGCSIYNIKDGDNSPDSRWSCSPTVGEGGEGVCVAQFDLNTNKNIRQIQLAFHKGDERHDEFSINVRTAGGRVAAVPSAITSGETTGFQTWDIAASTDYIEIQPKFVSVAQFMSIKEMILLKEEPSSDATPTSDSDDEETRSISVASTRIMSWRGVPDYIADGNGDQEEIMMAICDGIGEGFDGTDCDGVATGEEQVVDVILELGDFYLDGPVFLKSGVNLRGDSNSEEGSTEFIMHGSGTGADGVINAIGVSGALVEDIRIRSNLESAGPVDTVGNVCFDIKDSEDIIIDLILYFGGGAGCPLATARFVDTDRISVTKLSENANDEGVEVILDGVTDFILEESEIQGATIKDSVNVLFEGGRDNGDPVGSIGVPGEGGDQSANLVVSGTTSGVTLKELAVGSGAEPRIVLENANPFTIDEVTFPGGTAGDCIIQIPQGSDGNAVLIQLNVETDLVLEGECFVLA